MTLVPLPNVPFVLGSGIEESRLACQQTIAETSRLGESSFSPTEFPKLVACFERECMLIEDWPTPAGIHRSRVANLADLRQVALHCRPDPPFQALFFVFIALLNLGLAPTALAVPDDASLILSWG